MNTQRLIALAEHVKGLPHVMVSNENWGSSRMLSVLEVKHKGLKSFNMEFTSLFRPDCGTLGCLAGHACSLFEEVKDKPKYDSVLDRARILLGLSHWESACLFDPHEADYGLPFPYKDITPQWASEACMRLVDMGVDGSDQLINPIDGSEVEEADLVRLLWEGV